MRSVDFVLKAWLKALFIKLGECHYPMNGCYRATNFYTETWVRRNSGKTYSEKIRRIFEKEVSDLKKGLKTWTKIRDASIIKILFRYLSLKAARVNLELLNFWGGGTITRQNAELLSFFYGLLVNFRVLFP